MPDHAPAAKPKWEHVTGDRGYTWTERLKVPGGWLYRTTHQYAVESKHFPDTACVMNTTFVAEPTNV